MTQIYIVDNEKNEIKSSNEINIIGHSQDGETALKEIPTLKPDVVIMDIVLPKIDGFMLIERLKQYMGDKCPKIIVTSALCHEGFISKAFSIGASYYLNKPVSNEVLVQRIKDVISENNQNKQNINQKNRGLDEKISNIFITVGIPAHIKGYQFLREAIKLAIETPDIINSITKKLYPAIADRFSTTASKVERAIRHAIEVAWNRGKIENINSVFGLRVYTSQEKPTNGEFIALVADKMIIEGA